MHANELPGTWGWTTLCVCVCGGGRGRSMCECVYVMNVCVCHCQRKLLPWVQAQRCRMGRMCLSSRQGWGEDSQKTLAILPQPRKLCSSAGSWACPHRSCHLGMACITCPWISHSQRLNTPLPRREARPALSLATSLAQSPLWSRRLPAPARGTGSADQVRHRHRLLSG